VQSQICRVFAKIRERCVAQGARTLLIGPCGDEKGASKTRFLHIHARFCESIFPHELCESRIISTYIHTLTFLQVGCISLAAVQRLGRVMCMHSTHTCKWMRCSIPVASASTTVCKLCTHRCTFIPVAPAAVSWAMQKHTLCCIIKSAFICIFRLWNWIEELHNKTQFSNKR
jgi:hypothetical protein